MWGRGQMMNRYSKGQVAILALGALFYSLSFFAKVEAAAVVEKIHYEVSEESGKTIKVIIEGTNLKDLQIEPWQFPEKKKAEKTSTSDLSTVGELKVEGDEPQVEMSYMDQILYKEEKKQEKEALKPRPEMWELTLKNAILKKNAQLTSPIEISSYKETLRIFAPPRSAGRWGQVESKELILGISLVDGSQKKKKKKDGPIRFDRLEYTFTLTPRPTFQLANPEALKGKVVVIDPGHGGKDAGAVGLAGTREKDINLMVSLQLQEELKKWGAKPVITRKTDTDDMDELGDRVRFGQKNRGDIFISLHSDAALNREATGFTVFYYSPKGQIDLLLAKTTQQGLKQYMQTKDRGIRSANFFVIKRNPAPSILIEMGFISNRVEEQELMNPEYQRDVVEGTVQGVANYFSELSSLPKKDSKLKK